MIAAPGPDICDETADRSKDLCRIPMAPQEFGIRIRLDKRFECEHVHRRPQVPQARLAVPLQQFQHIAVEGVGLAHVALQQPFDVARNPYHSVEVEGAEAHAHQVLAFRRGFGIETVHGPKFGKHLVDHRDALGALRDARVVVLRRGLGRRGRRLGFPGAQRSQLWIGRDQLA